MFHIAAYQGTREEQYNLVKKQLQALIEDEPNRIANLSNASALLNQFLDRINWVGFYLLDGKELVLGPFQGLPACVRIPVGKGVCGTAFREERILRVEDVNQFAGHIACDSASKSEINEVESGIQEVKEKIDVLYELLEKEVHAKHYIIKNHDQRKRELAELSEANHQIKDETDFVQQSYQLLEGDLNIPNNLEKSLMKLMKRYESLETKIIEDDSIYTELGNDLKEISEKIEEIRNEQESFITHLQNLRKDEIEARETLKELKRKINETTRIVAKSNAPGLPIHYQDLLTQANENIRDVFNSLNEKPLNIKVIQNYLNVAVDSVEHLHEKTVELVESILLAEKVIQYGNRYRLRNQKLAAGLEKAEDCFRSFDFASALEEAATAVEEVEPGALKRIEEMLNIEDL